MSQVQVYAPVWEHVRDKMRGYGAHILYYVTGRYQQPRFIIIDRRFHCPAVECAYQRYMVPLLHEN
jgi:hypothetical protein